MTQVIGAQTLAFEQEQPRMAFRWMRRAIAASLVLLTLLVYRHAFSADFINWDDWGMVSGNARLTDPTFANLAKFWTEYDTGFLALYTPMAYSAWWVIARIFGIHSATPFHAASVAFHVCNVLLVFAILQRLLRTRFDDLRTIGGAALGAALFAAHPMQAEPVCWISGFNNLIAATFGLYALMRFIDSLTAPTRPRAIENYVFATIGLFLALCSKPTALVIPLLAGAVAVLAYPGLWRKAAIRLIPWVGLMAPFILIGQQVQNASFQNYPLWHRPILIADTFAFYWGKALIPLRISPDYGRTPQIVIETWLKNPLWLLTPALASAAIYWFRRFRWLAIALILSLAAIAPTSGVTPFFFQSYSGVADRYFYLGMIGPAIALAAIVASWPKRSTIWIAGSVLVALASMTFHQAIRWGSTYTWCLSILEQNPKSLVANMSLGSTYAKYGYYDKAKPYLSAGLEAGPQHPRVLLCMAMYCLDMKQPGDALTYMMFLLKRTPQYNEAYPLVKIAAARNGTPDLGIMALEGVVQACPKRADAHAHLGTLYGLTGQYEKAYQHLWTALQMDAQQEDALKAMSQLQKELAEKRKPATTKPADAKQQ